VIPASALRSDQAQPYAIRVAGGRTERRVLQLGARGRAQGTEVVEVMSGLVEGDQVLAAAAGLVAGGVPVRVGAALPAAASASMAAASR